MKLKITKGKVFSLIVIAAVLVITFLIGGTKGNPPSLKMWRVSTGFSIAGCNDSGPAGSFGR
jgi:hypothetical protein